MPDRILVVEDNLALAENVAEILGQAGNEIILCADAESAAQEAAQRGFDLAIVDIGLRGKQSGLELVPLLRRTSPHAEVLLMTGNASLQSAIQAIRTGVYAYVQKPFESDQFATLVERALAQVALKREKHALSQRLAASEALYRGVVDSAEACIVGLDRAGQISFANRFASELLAPSHGELLGRSLLDLTDAGSRERLSRALAGAVAGQSIRDQECLHQHERTIRWTLTPLTGHLDLSSAGRTEASVTAVLAVGVDLTARLEFERQHAEREAMAAMGSLATSLAHEIRNPLNAAGLQLELLLRRLARAEHSGASDSLAGPAQLVRSELRRLSQLLNEFLSLARPRTLQKTTCDVAALLDDVIMLKAPLAQTAGVALERQAIEPELCVRADVDRLKQVLINLVGNAIEALEQTRTGERRVELSALPDQAGVWIAVSDTGPGIASDVAGRAFKAFVTSKEGGTGLGLAIVEKIVAQHGGRVELVLREGGGTIARFFIPG